MSQGQLVDRLPQLPMSLQPSNLGNAIERLQNEEFSQADQNPDRASVGEAPHWTATFLTQQPTPQQHAVPLAATAGQDVISRSRYQCLRVEAGKITANDEVSQSVLAGFFAIGSVPLRVRFAG